MIYLHYPEEISGKKALRASLYLKRYFSLINKIIKMMKRSDQRKAAERRKNFMHRLPSQLNAKPGVSDGQTIDDEKIIHRLIAAYKRDRSADSTATSIWEYIEETHQMPLYKILVGNDENAIENLLRRPGDTKLFYGFEGGLSAKAAREFKKNGKNTEGLSLPPHDHLVRLAEIVGAMRLENPECSPPAGHGLIPTDRILDAIDRQLSIRVSIPNPFPDEVGTMTSRGILTFRTVHAIYQAWRISNLVAGIPNPRILEIGGGLGRTAYHAWQMGIRDYTIIDLPFTAVSQGYFLMRTLGAENVILHGEAQPDAAPKIKLLQPSAFLLSSQKYDLIVNVDSLPEMDRATATKYWRHIQATTSQFLSINQEANEFTVQDLADSDMANVKFALRYPNGLRKGYIEEVFSF